MRKLRPFFEFLFYKKVKSTPLSGRTTMILNRINKGGKIINYILLMVTLLSITGLMVFYLNFSYQNRNGEDPKIFSIWETILIFLPSYLLIPFFAIATKSPWKNYKLLRWSILFNFHKDNTYALNYVILLVIRAFFSFVITSVY